MRRIWKHETKFKNKKFFGFYGRTSEDSYSERIFSLKEIGGKRIISFESFQMAKKLGWGLWRVDECK